MSDVTIDSDIFCNMRKGYTFRSKTHIYNLLKTHEHIKISLYNLNSSNIYKY